MTPQQFMEKLLAYLVDAHKAQEKIFEQLLQEQTKTLNRAFWAILATAILGQGGTIYSTVASHQQNREYQNKEFDSRRYDESRPPIRSNSK